MLCSCYPGDLFRGLINSALYNLIRHMRQPLLALGILLLASNPALPASDTDSTEIVRRQITMTQNYLGSDTAKKIDASGNEQARQLLRQARTLFSEGNGEFDQGNLDAARQKLMLAIQKFTAAAAANAKKGVDPKKMSAEIEAIRAEIDAYLGSFNAALAEKGPSMAGLLDQQYVADLMSQAGQLQSDGDYQGARSSLNEAKRLIVDALIKVRNNETVVYTVEFQTPADEFRYENERYREYQVLGQKVLDNGDIAQSRKKLFEQLRRKSEQLSEEAVALAGQGNYPAAIGRMEDAVNKMVQGLRMLGIPLSM